MMGPGLKGQRRGWGGRRGQQQGLLEALGGQRVQSLEEEEEDILRINGCRWSKESGEQRGDGCSQEAPGGTGAMLIWVLVLTKSNEKLLQ